MPVEKQNIDNQNSQIENCEVTKENIDKKMEELGKLEKLIYNENNPGEGNTKIDKEFRSLNINKITDLGEKIRLINGLINNYDTSNKVKLDSYFGTDAMINASFDSVMFDKTNIPSSSIDLFKGLGDKVNDLITDKPNRKQLYLEFLESNCYNLNFAINNGNLNDVKLLNFIKEFDDKIGYIKQYSEILDSLNPGITSLEYLFKNTYYTIFSDSDIVELEYIFNLDYMKGVDGGDIAAVYKNLELNEFIDLGKKIEQKDFDGILKITDEYPSVRGIYKVADILAEFNLKGTNFYEFVSINDIGFSIGRMSNTSLGMLKENLFSKLEFTGGDINAIDGFIKSNIFNNLISNSLPDDKLNIYNALLSIVASLFSELTEGEDAYGITLINLITEGINNIDSENTNLVNSIIDENKISSKYKINNSSQHTSMDEKIDNFIENYNKDSNNKISKRLELKKDFLVKSIDISKYTSIYDKFSSHESNVEESNTNSSEILKNINKNSNLKFLTDNGNGYFDESGEFCLKGPVKVGDGKGSFTMKDNGDILYIDELGFRFEYGKDLNEKTLDKMSSDVDTMIFLENTGLYAVGSSGLDYAVEMLHEYGLLPKGKIDYRDGLDKIEKKSMLKAFNKIGIIKEYDIGKPNHRYVTGGKMEALSLWGDCSNGIGNINEATFIKKLKVTNNEKS